MPAGGTVVRSIAAGTGVNPDIIVGKPNALIFDIIKKEHGLEEKPLSKFLMIGDTLITDIKFGNNSRIDTLLVLSGNMSAKRAIDLKKGQRRPEEGEPTLYNPYFAWSEKI